MSNAQVSDIKANPDAAIQAVGLTKHFFNEYAVRDVTFQVPKGNIFGFIGPSGSGKTTTIRLLTGIYDPSSGKAFILGREPRRFGARMREEIGYMPQLFVLYPDLSVWENLNFAASLYGMSPFGRGKKMHRILEFVELNGQEHKLTRNISGGMQRRLSLAATLVHDPVIIFLDEPTAGIDPVLRAKFWERFQEIKKQGRTLFITTQYVSEAAYCDLVAVMNDGRILMIDTPANLRRKAFSGEIVDLEASQPLNAQQLYAIQGLPFVHGRLRVLSANALRLTVDEASTAIPDLLEWGRSHGINIDSVKEFTPPFDDVFVQIIQNANASDEKVVENA